MLNPTESRRIPRIFLTSLMMMFVSTSMTEVDDSQCWWKLKEGGGPVRMSGIVCTEDQVHYDVAILSCEGGPLSLMLQSYCGRDRTTCAVRMTLDAETYDLVGENISSGEIWDGVVDIPLQGQAEIIQALGRASRFELDIEKANRTWTMPTRGLDETVDALSSNCEAHVM
jgi:hypothetical protein